MIPSLGQITLINKNIAVVLRMEVQTGVLVVGVVGLLLPLLRVGRHRRKAAQRQGRSDSEAAVVDCFSRGVIHCKSATILLLFKSEVSLRLFFIGCYTLVMCSDLSNFWGPAQIKAGLH